MNNSTAIKESNSNAVGVANSSPNKISLMSKKRRRDLTPEEKERASRLNALWENHRRENPSVTQESAALEMGWTTQGSVSQYLRGTIPLNMAAGHRFATLFGVSITEIEPAWADAASPRDGHRVLAMKAKKTKDAISIPIMDAPGSMGDGVLAPENDTIVGGMRLSMWFVRHELPSISRPGALRVVTGRGDSMKPTFRDGDPLIVDTGITSIQDDAVYMFYRDDKLFIKRLQQLSGGALMVISDNERFKDEKVSAEDAKHIRVIARVLYAWRGERL